MIEHIFIISNRFRNVEGGNRFYIDILDLYIYSF